MSHVIKHYKDTVDAATHQMSHMFTHFMCVVFLKV